MVEALDVHEGDDIEIRIADDSALEVRKMLDPEALLTRLRRFRGRLPEGFVFDRNERHIPD